MGTVFVFNTTTVPIMLTINQESAGSKIREVREDTNPAYQPAVQAIARSNVDDNNGVFLNGQENIVAIKRQTGTSDPAKLKIPYPDKSTDDLSLYIAQGEMILLNDEGKILSTTQIDWTT